MDASRVTLEEQLRLLTERRDAAAAEKRAMTKAALFLEKQATVNSLNAQISNVRRELIALDRQENAALESQRIERSKAAVEGATFWFKRFFTTLGIANAGAFAALASGVLQADDVGKIAGLVAPAMVHFTQGMLASGSIPLFLWLRYFASDAQSRYFDRNRFQTLALPILEWLAQLLVILATVRGVWEFAAGLFSALGSLQGTIH